MSFSADLLRSTLGLVDADVNYSVNCDHRSKPMFSPTSYLMSRGCPHVLLTCCLPRASCACAEYTKPTGPGLAKPLTVGPFMKIPNSSQLNNNFRISFRKLLLQYGCHDLTCVSLGWPVSDAEPLCAQEFHGHQNNTAAAAVS